MQQSPPERDSLAGIFLIKDLSYTLPTKGSCGKHLLKASFKKIREQEEADSNPVIPFTINPLILFDVRETARNSKFLLPLQCKKKATWERVTFIRCINHDL